MTRHMVAKVGEIPEGECKLVEVAGMELGIFHLEGRYFAYRNVCPHAGAPVCKGRIAGTSLPSGVYQYEYGCEQQILRCPWHGWEFDLTTGRHLVDEKVRLRSYPIQSHDENLASEDLTAFATETDESLIYVVL